MPDQLPPPVDRDALAGDLGRGGYLRGHVVGDEVHGRWYESGLVLTRPGVLRRCAELLSQRIPENTDRIAARGNAAVAVATAVALAMDAQLLFGEDDAVTGELCFVGDGFPGARVVLLEDIVLTGGHAAQSVEALKAGGFSIVGVVALIDREGAGRNRLETKAGVTYEAEFRESELLP